MKAILSSKIIRKIVFMSLILVLLLGVGVFAARSDVNTVKIVYSDGHETSFLTSKVNVEEILDDAHVIVNNDEYVVPSKDSNIDLTKTILIRKNTDDKIIVAEEIANVSKEEILGKYDTITEKIITEQEEIPFETVTKDISTSEEEAVEKVVQEGRNGIKEITYRVKLRNEEEIEREQIGEEIIQEPVDKIIQIANKVISRGGSRGVSFTGSSGWSYSAEEMDLICAITAQEDSTSYEGALAVITTACNRAENRGTDPLTEYKRKGQFCYTIDNYWRRRLNGNYAGFVEQAVEDALNGARNHNYTSFRASGYGERIGSNVYR